MKSKVFRTQYPVPCERCGQLIRKGEKCLVQMDAKLGVACFTHAHCPGACATARKPRYPKLPTLKANLVPSLV